MDERPAPVDVPDAAGAAPHRGSIKHGMLLVLMLHLLQLLWFVDEPVWIWFIGVTQAIYVIPALIVTAIKRRTHTVGGIFIGAALTALLNFTLASMLCSGRYALV